MHYLHTHMIHLHIRVFNSHVNTYKTVCAYTCIHIPRAVRLRSAVAEVRVRTASPTARAYAG